MKIDFILVAGGSISVPRINHVIFQEDAERAKEEAKEAVALLAKAGHFTFDLFDCRDPENKTNVIASYRVEIPEPVVTIKTK